MQARVRVLDEQEHRLLRRACSDVAAVLLSEVVGAEVEAEVDAQVRALWAAQLHTQVEEERELTRARVTERTSQ